MSHVTIAASLVVDDGGSSSDEVAGRDGSTIERYLSAIDGPGNGTGVVDVAVAGAEKDVDGTNGTRFRLMPAPKTRWSSRGRKYSSSS